MPTTTPSSPRPLVCPPLPPVRPCDVRRRDRKAKPSVSGRRRHWELVRALAGIESYAKRRGGPASELVSACVWDLVDGPAGLLFRRADRWGLAFYVANVTTGKLPNALDRRGVWERHFTPEVGEAGGEFLDPLREFRNSARRERSRRLDS